MACSTHLPLFRIAREQERRGAQRLEREHGVRERRMVRQRLAHHAAGPEVLRADRLEPALLAQQAAELAGALAGTLVVVEDLAAGQLARPERSRGLGQLVVTRLDERPHRVEVDHSNLGGRFATNAS
jgi:hypothetical protein